MSYCPDKGCEFNKDYPNGYDGKKLNCPLCKKKLTRKVLTKKETSDPTPPKDNGKMVKITFHTLVLKEYYDDIENIRLKIGHPHYGHFLTPSVKFESLKTVVEVQKDKFFIIYGTIEFPVKFMTSGSIVFQYKYFYKIRYDNEESYEHLHHTSNTNFNRYFNLQVRLDSINDVYDHFDVMMLPETRKGDRLGVSSLASVHENYVTSNAPTDRSIRFYNIEDRMLKSLLVLLPSDYGCGYSKALIDFDKVLFQIHHIAKLLSHSCIHDPHIGYERFWLNQEITAENNLKELVEAWMKEVYKPERNVHLDPKTIICKFYLACCLLKDCDILNSLSVNILVADMVKSSIVDIIAKKSYKLDNITTDNNFAKELKQAIFEFIFERVMPSKNPVRVLTLIPIYHLITNLNVKAEELHRKLDYGRNEYWGFPADARFVWLPNCSFDSIEVQNALSLVERDPVLHYTIAMYTLCERNAELLCNHYIYNSQGFPISTLMGVLLVRLCNSQHQIEEAVTKYNNLRRLVMETLCDSFTKNPNFAFDDIYRLNLLTITFAQKLPSRFFNFEQFKLCLMLISHGYKYCYFKKPGNHIPKNKIKELFNGFVLSWYKLCIRKQHLNMEEFSDEIQFWKELMSVYSFAQSTEWKNSIREFLRRQFTDTYVSHQCIVQTLTTCQIIQILKEILIDQLYSRLDNLNSEERELMIKKLLTVFEDNGLKSLEKILSKALLDEKEKFELNNYQHFISWNLWSTYFSFNDCDSINQFLNKEAKSMYDKAKKSFQRLLESIHDMKINVSLLEEIAKNLDHFKNLVNIHLLARPSEDPSGSVHEDLGKCLSSCNWFEEQKDQLRILYEFIGNFNMIDNKIIQLFLSQNYSSYNIGELCIIEEDSQIKLQKYPEIANIITFEHFKCICKICNLIKESSIIMKVFETVIRDKHIQPENFNISIFFTTIWLPVWDICKNIFKNISNKSIILSNMCKYLDVTQNYETIQNELASLQYGCQLYHSVIDSAPIPESSTKKIHIYFTLLQLSQVASLICDMREELLIKSNFDVIHNMKNASEQYSNKPLSEMNAIVEDIAKDLALLKIDIMSVIKENINLFLWIRNNIKDINEVRAFVDISLTICGDSRVDVDRITCFNSVCTNFAPLIFGIDRNTGYRNFIVICLQIVSNVGRNRQLIKLLKEVGNNINFWEQLRQFHGTVEQTTVMQLDNIIKSGSFHFNLGYSFSLDDMISLSVQIKGKETKIYTLEQLKEFRSKCMLVVGISEEARYKDFQVLDLTLNIIVDIAKTIVQLEICGQHEYHTHISHLSEAEASLTQIQSKLSSLLQDFRKSIHTARENSCCLNYYTTPQVVSLQKGIKSFLRGIQDESLEQLYHLLRLLNHGVTKKVIQHTLKESDIKISNHGNFNARSPSTSESKKYINGEVSETKHYLPMTISGIKDGSIEVYTDINRLCGFLERISKSSTSKLNEERKLHGNLRLGIPNLVAIPSNEILEFVLSLYLTDDDNLPLPFYHEILFCTDQTTIEEVDIFWRRVMMNPQTSHKYLFCMVNIENLKYEVAVRAFAEFKDKSSCGKMRGKEAEKYLYKLVLICSEEKEGVSYIAAAFEDFKRSNFANNIPEIIERNLTKKLSHTQKPSKRNAWIIDNARSRVKVVSSNSVGAGKSLYINNLKSAMFKHGVVRQDEIDQAVVTVCIHGKQVSEENITNQLLRNLVTSLEHGVIFHVDIASTIQLGLSPILFKLLILGGVCNSSGKLWLCRLSDYYVIEITLNPNQINLGQFVRKFPIINCLQPNEALTTTADNQTHTIDLITLAGEQSRRVNDYLKRLETGQNLDKFFFKYQQKRNENYPDIIQNSLQHCGIHQPSWCELRNFVNFLNNQLSDSDNSVFCKSGLMGEDWNGFKSFVVKFMLQMSKDFATPSLQRYSGRGTHDITNFQILNERRWENNPHPYIFFNPDGHTMTFLGFQISKDGNLLDSNNPSVIIKNNIMLPKLFQTLTENRVNLQEDYNKLSKIEKVAKIASVLGLDFGPNSIDPDPEYVLTLDNVIKILAILMRFRCNIPVVIMGETGCGKTRLIQFMCSLQALQTGATNMLILKVHGGTTERDVMCRVEEAEKLARHNFHYHNIDTILFFDEANTSPAIGLIKEIMCDRRMYGKHISSDIRLQFIAACNPYRRHTKEMLHKLSTAGLGFFTKSSDTTDRLGDIPLRELVYRVMELPASMRPLVWDFGQLSNDIEKTYTREIVAKHLRDKKSPIAARDDVVDAISEVLAGAQNYMRERNDECSFVSLRDVERAMRVLLWFYKMINFIAPDYYLEEREDAFVPHPTTVDTASSLSSDIASLFVHSRTSAPIPAPRSVIPTLQSGLVSPPRTGVPINYTTDPTLRIINGIDRVSYSLILAVAVCYRARLQVRTGFDRDIANRFKHPLTPIPNYRVIDKEIDRCQQNILEQMSVGEHIAKNKALKENVFMMLVCIELKIPLFVIGKPGSSKSLAKTIISNNMQGNKCQDGSVLRNFKQVHIMSYQCSQLATAEGIIGVFKNCRKMQRKTRSSRFVSCVVLDEVGLAEDSPLLPLKVLHPLLEDSSYGAEDTNEDSEMCPTSDYEPDESRDDVDREHGNSVDQVAFIGISNWSLDPAKMNRGIMVARGDPDQEELLSSANEICRSSSVDTTLLESILACIPSLAKAYLNLVKTTPTTREYYGLRDFYSLIKMLVFLCNEYKVKLNSSIFKHCVYRNFGGATGNQALKLFSQAVKLSDDTQGGPDCSPLGLIRANLSSFSTSFYGETRYLLLLTENYSALNILLKSSDMWPDNKFDDIRVIFGSNFPRDQEYSTVCRNINKIKVCMETGKTVILLNLENLYESLYDALNQYYMKIYNQRYVDLGLGTHRMKCRVHENFKLIVIADKETVYSTFPTPLINRLEKHFLTMSTVLSENGQTISKRLAGWANELSTLDKNRIFGFQKRGNFTVGDCFIGFHEDTPPSIVFNVMKEMFPDNPTPDTEVDMLAVLERCQTLLLRMATTDAVLRVKNSLLSFQSDFIIAEYFKLHLSSLEEYLRHVLSSTCNEMTGSHLTLATTHSRLLTDRDVDQLKQRLSTGTETNRIEITSLSLQQFQTELQYTREIQRFLRGESGVERREGFHKKILLIQCEKGADNAKLIACARHKTVDELKDWREERREFHFEVCLVFLIQLNREVHGSKFVSFCGGEWNTVHIDDIRSLDYKELPPVSELIGKQIYQLFEEEREEFGVTFSRSTRLQQCIQSAVSRLVDMNGSEKRTLIRLQQFIQLLERNETFSQTLCQRLISLMKEQFESSNDLNNDWLLQTANCGEDIQSSGTFRKAINLRINNTITPLLAELIACLDRNGNLELALYNKEVPECLFNLWQDIFKDERLLVLQYKDIVSPLTLLPRRRVPVLSDGAGGQYFPCSFPFSSLIRGFVQDLWKQFTLTKDKTEQVWIQFEGIFNQTNFGSLINRNLMSDETDYDFILQYLMDFIYMNRTQLNQQQYNIYESVIMLRVGSFSTDNSVTDEGVKGNSLSIPKIHCAYEESKQLLDLLQEAFAVNDNITNKLFGVILEMNKTKDVRLECLELVLVEEIVASCSHTKGRTVTEDLAEKYIAEIRRWEPVVERGLSFSRPHRPDYTTTVKLLGAQWNRILTVELFISQCVLVVGHSNTQSSINSLFLILTETPDFTCVQTIRNILMVLSDCLTRLPGGQKNLLTRKQKFRECATKFFINILTRLTFKSLWNREPGPELVELLMGFVTLDEDNMKELERNEKSSIVLFKKNSLNPSLSFKMFLMQLMIKHRRDVFEDILSNYLAKPLCDFDNSEAKKELYMIIIQSIEDSLHQNFKQKDFENQIQTIQSLLRNDFTGVSNLAKHSFLSYSLLGMIATLRFVCTHISHWIPHFYNLTQTQTQTPPDVLRQREGLIIQFKNLCLMYGQENLHVFLLKNIYHQLGSDTLHQITENYVCSWIIPEYVMEKMCDSQFSPDYFMIYGDNYARIKYSVEQANVSQCKDSLLQFFDSEKNNLQDIRTNVEYFLFSIFQIVSEALKRSNDLSEEFITLRNLLNTDLSKIQDELLQLGLQMLSNNLGNRSIEFLQLSSNNSNHHIPLSRVIYHTAVMLSSNAYPELFSPISLLYENPGLLANMLFPTMMDDQLQTAKLAMVREGGGQWYSCVNGHAYFVGECGSPTQAQVCPDCGTWVGGQDHRVTRGGTALNTTADSTQHGYLLGRVEQRQKIPSSERSLSPASVSFIRALMDLSFIWSSCSRHTTGRNRSQVLPSLVRGGLDDPSNLSNFFYHHLERDVGDIAQLTGKNFEESTFLLHLVIRSLMDSAGQPCGGIPTELTQRESREQWEREFDRRFIQPILSSHTDVQRQMQQVLSEKRIANNPILRIVYEREEPERNNPLPHLWRYRTIVSLEHFSQSFSTADVKTKHKCPLVDKFLREESRLFVTRYLPNIVQLQRRVRDKFLHILDRREAVSTTIKEFLDRTRNENTQEWEELSNLVDNLATAWSMIGEDVRKNGRLKMAEALEQQEITPATCLAYLLPSSTGEGVLITSLTDYLVLIHNSFVHAYRDRVKESRSDRIPLRELNASHVIEYEEHLQPLLLSHAHYSLALGQGSHVTYDFEGVEQQFMEQFIQNKPLILAEHLRFEYTREAYNLDVFEQVRHKVQQTELKEIVWRTIREDLDSLEAVCDILLVLDVVIGFLSSAGGDPDQKVSSYLYEVLKYPHVSRGVGPLQSRKAEGNVNLKHILSFWRFLSIEKARKLSIIGQIPFSSLRDEFQEEVSREKRILIEQSCNYFPVEKILMYLHDFILFFVRERDSEEKNYGLRESIAIYGEEKDWKLPEGFKEFPEAIKLSQCAAAWAVLARQEHKISNPVNLSV